MEKFIPSNIYGICLSEERPELIQFLKDGTKRITNFNSGLVTIYDKEGKLIFNQRFETYHPLIINSKCYHFSHATLKTDSRRTLLLARMKRRGELPLKIEGECEEYYKINQMFVTWEKSK